MKNESYMVGKYPIKEVQNKMLNILKAVDVLCRKYHIAYVLDSGTLLGAIRHKGFIPWDDDIDIAMLREDYIRFQKIANELPAPYTFETMESRKDYPNLFGKVYDTSTRYVQSNTAHLDIQHGVFLDIFPMDKVRSNNKKIQCRFVASLNTIRCLKQKTEPFSLRHIFYVPLMLLPLRIINILADKVMMWHDSEELDEVCPICQSGTNKPVFNKSMFHKSQYTSFETEKFPVPVDYDEYLRGYYTTPMVLPPVEKRHPTHNIIEVQL